ncbi:hypothetical protein HY500_04260 [Candidatus Woesearchaeota archaeon]|nr:hypothetical protein [Candidatus Woesearchaeota archaeon]
MTNLIVDIKPRLIYSAHIYAPFDRGKEELENAVYKIISLQENAQLRMEGGKNAFVSQNGNWTREGFIYVPKRGIFLTRNSPIMANAQEATDCHRNQREFYLTDVQVEQSLVDSILLSGQPIPTSRFRESPIAVYAFGDIAEQYGLFLRGINLKEMPILLADLQDRPFARQSWFRRLDVGSRSSLYGNYKDLDVSLRVRGIRQVNEDTEKNPGLVSKL